MKNLFLRTESDGELALKQKEQPVQSLSSCSFVCDLCMLAQDFPASLEHSCCSSLQHQMKGSQLGQQPTAPGSKQQRQTLCPLLPPAAIIMPGWMVGATEPAGKKEGADLNIGSASCSAVMGCPAAECVSPVTIITLVPSSWSGERSR